MARSIFDQISDIAYPIGKAARTGKAIQRSIRTGSPAPIVKRLARIALGRGLGRGERRIGL